MSLRAISPLVLTAGDLNHDPRRKGLLQVFAVLETGHLAQAELWCSPLSLPPLRRARVRILGDGATNPSALLGSWADLLDLNCVVIELIDAFSKRGVVEFGLKRGRREGYWRG